LAGDPTNPGAGVSIKRQELLKTQRQISKTFLEQIIAKIFDNIDNASNNIQLKESMIFLLSSLSERIISYYDVLKHIEGIFIKHIFNELNANTAIVQNTTLLL